MDELQQKRKRYYSQIAEKFGDMMRADLALRQKYTKKSPIKIVTLANTFNLIVSPTVGAKRNFSNQHKFYTSANCQKDKMKQVLNFKQKLKHSVQLLNIFRQIKVGQRNNKEINIQQILQDGKKIIQWQLGNQNQKKFKIRKKIKLKLLKEYQVNLLNVQLKIKGLLNCNMHLDVYKEDLRKNIIRFNERLKQIQLLLLKKLVSFQQINKYYLNLRLQSYQFLELLHLQVQPMFNENQIKNDKSRGFRIYTTIVEIAEQRGYYVPEAKKMSSQEQYQRNKHQLERQMFYLDGEADQKNALGIHLNISRDKIQQNMVTKFLDIFKGNYQTLNSIIFVAGTKDKKDKAESDKQIQHKIFQQTSIRIQIFKEEDLLFNVLKHDLVPQHKVLKQQEKASILAYYKVKESQLPKILVSDPAARFLGLRKGQVVKITRKSQTAGLYTTYRIAV